MDRFFTQEYCDRCGGSLGGRIMSRFNTACLCMECSEKEEEALGYKEAVESEISEIKNGNYKYKGIKS